MNDMVYFIQHSSSPSFIVYSVEFFHCFYYLYSCICFTWKRGGGGGRLQVRPLKRDQELTPCQTQPVPGSPKTVPQLAKVEPISDIGPASVIIYLRKDKGH